MKKLILFALLALPLIAANNGTVVGTPTFGAAHFSNGLTATSASNYITLPSGVLTALGTTPTISLWVNATANVNYQSFVSLDANNYIGIHPDGSLYFALFGTPFVYTAIPISGAWHHIELTYYGGQVVFFLDGVLTSNTPATFAAPSGSGAIIGDNAHASTEKIDELAFWSTILHTNNFTPPASAYTGSETNLVALYHLESDGTDSVMGAGSLSSHSPTSIPVWFTGNVITLTGIGTGWTPGTPGSPTFSLSGGTGASITAQSVASATSATITVTAGSTAGTLTITDPSTSTTLPLTVTTATSFNYLRDAAPRKLYSAASNPTTCPVGTIFFKTGVTDGQNIYGCTSTDVWTLQAGNSGVWGAIAGTLASQSDLSIALGLKAASVHTHVASDTTGGVFAIARLASGAPTGLKFVRDDGTLAVPAGSGAVADPGANGVMYRTALNVTTAVTGTGTNCVHQDGTSAACGSGSGASSVSGLTDIQVTRTNSTTLAVAIGNVMVSGVSYSIAAGTVGVSAGTGTIRIAVDTSQTPPTGKVYFSSGLTVTCSWAGCTTPTAGAAFGPDDIQTATSTITTGTFDISGITDLRGIASKSRTVNGAGIVSSISGHTQTLSVDSAIYPVTLAGTTASVGGGALAAGACASTTTTVTGAAIGMAVAGTPTTYPGDATQWKSYVSATDTVITKICALVAATPTASTYNVRILP